VRSFKWWSKSARGGWEDLTKLSRDEMRVVGYPDDTPEINVCAGIE
jgi:hypothetical protein